MEAVFDEKMIREELKRMDGITGLHGAELPIRFGNARSRLGYFSCEDAGSLFFGFSNYYFMDPMLPVEEKLDVIRHEYAHYYDYMLHGSSSHGPLWKKCCREVGALPIRCFSRKRADIIMEQHEREAQTNTEYDRITVGTEIAHAVFGKGVIDEITGEGINRIAVVSFSKVGTKRLAVGWIAEKCKLEYKF